MKNPFHEQIAKCKEQINLLHQKEKKIWKAVYIFFLASMAVGIAYLLSLEYLPALSKPMLACFTISLLVLILTVFYGVQQSGLKQEYSKEILMLHSKDKRLVFEGTLELVTGSKISGTFILPEYGKEDFLHLEGDAVYYRDKVVPFHRKK